MAETAGRANVTALRKDETAREGRGEAAPGRSRARLDRKSRRQIVRWSLLILGPLLVVLGIGWFWLTGGRYVSTDNAYVQADLVNVATDVAGLVKTIQVHDNQEVRKGDVLFTLDDSTYRNALASAEANLALARTDLEALKASYAQNRAAIAKAEADVTFYEKEYQRQLDLVNRRVAPQSQLDAAQHDLAAARNQLAALKQQLAGIAAQLGGDADAPVERHPRYQAALAAHDQAARNLDHTIVRAPMDGITAQVASLQPGEYLQAGQAAFALVATDHVWVEANPKETDLTFVRPGQPATVTVDTYPGHVWEGTVASLSPASQAQFSLLPAQNTSGNWVKVVQRIPIRIQVRTRPGEPQLRAGMSAEIEIDTGHQRHLRDLLAWL
ncbi:HlyD family secretion protein [Benzoatithermus flavus]|uniref:HlyD family secretion protein n=1 Tax=Benzoatithermus flavus TaxID=3108223 RepID=A0ABU8XPZ5_9PROT